MFFIHCKQFGVSGHTQYCSGLPFAWFCVGWWSGDLSWCHNLHTVSGFLYILILNLSHFWWKLLDTYLQEYTQIWNLLKNTFKVTMFHVFWYYVGRLDFCLVISICGDPKTLYGQDLAFRLEGKCKAAIQNRKKIAKPTVGFHFIFSILLAAFIITVAKL